MGRSQSPIRNNSVKRHTSRAWTWIIVLIIFGFFIWIFSHSPSNSRTSSSSCLTVEVAKSIQTSEAIYDEYKAKLNQRVKSRPHEVKPWAPFTYPFDYFLATFACPFSVQRIGSLGDGGKWICGIERYQNSPCVLYSFGISNETSFEVEILEKTSCEIFAFDYSVDEVIGVPVKYGKRVHFSKTYAAVADSPDHLKLSSAMNANGHTHIDILKMDIEGGEFPVLEQILTEYGNNLPFSQLLIEIHAQISDGPSFAKLYDFFQKLETAGLRPFRNELNIALMVRSNQYSYALSEYSFLNINKLCG